MECSISFHVRVNMEGFQRSSMESMEWTGFRCILLVHCLLKLKSGEVFHVLQGLKLLAPQNSFNRELGKGRAEFNVLPIDHAEVLFYCRSVWKDSCNATVKLPQFWKAKPYRAPAVSKTHDLGRLSSASHSMLSSRMAFLNFLNSFSRSVQSPLRPL